MMGTIANGYTENGRTPNFRLEEKGGVLVLVEIDETISERKPMPPEQKRKEELLAQANVVPEDTAERSGSAESERKQECDSARKPRFLRITWEQLGNPDS
jgi:hypothetical protein